MNICVLAPENNAYPETFIRAHVTRLCGTVSFLFGGYFPTRRGDTGAFLVKFPGFVERAQRAFLTRALRMDFSDDTLREQAFYNYLLDNKIDAVLAEYGPTGAHVMKVCRKAGAALIVHFHGFDAYRKNALEEYRGKYIEMFQMADAIVCVSRHMEQALLAMGAPRQKLHYNPCGGDGTLFFGADPAAAPPAFMTTGRFVDKKGPHLTLLAFARVLAAVPEARLTMIGDGVLLDACKSLVKALGIEQSVEFPGAKSHEDVAQMMRRVRAFVQHSITPGSGDMEGTPVAVSEAGGAGLPVVATRHGGIPDVVLDGVTGFLVEECDVAAMADRMVRLAKDPSLARELGKAAQKRVLQQFTLEHTIAKLDQIISEAVQKKRSV